jgi:hypothetical protein
VAANATNEPAPPLPAYASSASSSTAPRMLVAGNGRHRPHEIRSDSDAPSLATAEVSDKSPVANAMVRQWTVGTIALRECNRGGV